MEIIKKNIKNIVVAVLLLITLIAVGIYNLQYVKAIEQKRSSYLRTEFDYIVEMPTDEELGRIKADASVESVYPFHLYTNLFTASSKASKIKAFVSTDAYKGDETIGFLGNGTLIKGSFDGAGAVLDEKAASVLGVGVGDKISFLWGTGASRKTFTQKVKAVCLACSYNMYTDGVVLLDYTSEMIAAYDIEIFTGAFVKANDASCLSKLRSIVDTYKNIDVKESLYEANAKHKTDVFESQVNATNLGLIFAVAILYSGLNALFIVINKKNDEAERDSGLDKQKMFSSYAIGGISCAVAVAIISFVTLLIFGISTHFIDVGIKTVLALSLPALVSVPVVYIVAKAYTNKLYANHSKEQTEHLRDA